MNKTLSKIDALNDIVAVFKIPVLNDSGLEIPEETAQQLSNEGVVVGIGDDARGVIDIGDYVIFRPNRYVELHPESGGYAGKTVILARKLDILVKKRKPDNPYVVA